jgi:glycosyltransferase involved in cell wall biosynthesis
LEWSGLPPESVVNVGNGVDPIYSPGGNIYAPGYRYFLCVSNRRGHKNEAGLLKAFAAVVVGNDVKLVLTGRPSPEVEAIIQEEELASRVVFTGLVPEDELPALYRGAIALVFPSFYEGFGLPVVEAMACGTPVITSDVTSLPEVAGGAALLVDPHSVQDIAAAMRRILTEPELGKELARKGVEQAKKFSWDDVAARIKTVLREVELQ